MVLNNLYIKRITNKINAAIRRNQTTIVASAYQSSTTLPASLILTRNLDMHFPYLAPKPALDHRFPDSGYLVSDCSVLTVQKALRPAKAIAHVQIAHDPSTLARG